MTPHFPALPPPAILLGDYLYASAARTPDKIALATGTEHVSYRELLDRATALAATLVARGLAPGDRVLTLGDNTVETVVGLFGTLISGGTVVIASPLTRADRLAYLLEDTRAQALLSTATLSAVFAEVAPRSRHLRTVVVWGGLPAEQLARLPGGVDGSHVEAESQRDEPLKRRAIELDLAVIIYTSGSTGTPKGVMHTHASLRAAASSIILYLGLSADDVFLGALPLSFGYGLFQVLSAIAVGGTVVLERGFTFPPRVLEKVAEERVTCFAGVPSVFALLGGLAGPSGPDLSSVRLVTSAAAALSGRQEEIVRRLFPSAKLFSMYGQTECIRGTFLPPDVAETKPGSIGIPIPNTEAWLVDEHDRRVAPGEVGQLVLRGPHVMRGYWERPTETAAKLRPGPLPGETVLYTGDLARMDEHGFLYFVARMDDVVKSRGEKVAPKEVEMVVSQLEGVREVAVIGVPDDVLGQAIKAFVVLEAGISLSARDVQLHCRARLESYMVPKHVSFVPDLPKTSNGKVAKLGLA